MTDFAKKHLYSGDAWRARTLAGMLRDHPSQHVRAYAQDALSRWEKRANAPAPSRPGSKDPRR